MSADDGFHLHFGRGIKNPSVDLDWGIIIRFTADSGGLTVLIPFSLGHHTALAIINDIYAS